MKPVPLPNLLCAHIEIKVGCSAKWRPTQVLYSRRALSSEAQVFLTTINCGPGTEIFSPCSSSGVSGHHRPSSSYTPVASAIVQRQDRNRAGPRFVAKSSRDRCSGAPRRGGWREARAQWRIIPQRRRALAVTPVTRSPMRSPMGSPVSRPVAAKLPEPVAGEQSARRRRCRLVHVHAGRIRGELQRAAHFQQKWACF